MSNLEYMDNIDAINSKNIISITEKLLPLLKDDDYIKIAELYNKHHELVKQYNWDSQTILNLTKKELGNFLMGAKKTLKANFPKNNWHIIDKLKHSDFSERLKVSMITLYRRCDWYNRPPLEKAAHESLKIELIDEFKILINDTSK